MGIHLYECLLSKTIKLHYIFWGIFSVKEAVNVTSTIIVVPVGYVIILEYFTFEYRVVLKLQVSIILYNWWLNAVQVQIIERLKSVEPNTLPKPSVIANKMPISLLQLLIILHVLNAPVKQFLEIKCSALWHC